MLSYEYFNPHNARHRCTAHIYSGYCFHCFRLYSIGACYCSLLFTFCYFLQLGTPYRFPLLGYCAGSPHGSTGIFDAELPPIKFEQGTLNACAIYSLASALHAFGDVQAVQGIMAKSAVILLTRPDRIQAMRELVKQWKHYEEKVSRLFSERANACQQ